ncbi:MAG: glycerol-3-phosphate 1-O-acyltransferase PlsY [Bacteroidales bacterium]|nr:glycerol-3-phosphate 1-O-acyltransferase PlsY [Bacteroidales bacterium]MBN2764549.1 glycerol-3-phosphate 1-O-acyltransferase PlsY [Bacteroidales bacterium]
MVTIVAVLILAYLLGSIPTSVWMGKWLFDIDLREHGSGNAGSTNAIRVLGWKTGLFVLVIDMFKGWLAVNLIHLTRFYIPETGNFITFQLMLGVAAILGHIFPVYVGFRGGKGVATLFGLVLAINPEPTLICTGIFVVMLIVSKYVSLSSMAAGFAFPIMVIFVFKETTMSLVIFSLIIAILLLFTHQKNIERLLRNQEKKVTFLMSKRGKERERMRMSA